MKLYELEIDDEGMFGVKAISLVENPAIEENWIALAEQVQLKEIDVDRRMIYGAALIPDKPIYRKRSNGEEYYIQFSKQVIEKTAHRFYMQNQHHNATVEHDAKANGVYFVESWIKEGDSDKSKVFGYDLPDGTWFVGAKITDDDLWKKVKSGEVRGWSIEGLYIEQETDIELAAMLEELEQLVK
jgi:hypothetical protein